MDYIEVARIEHQNYWIATALRRWRDAASHMPSDWHSKLAIDFGSFLIEEIGPNKAALQVGKQSNHILILSERIPGHGNPTRDQIRASYTAADIRKADLFFRFLRSFGVDVPSRSDLFHVTEEKRIRAILKNLEGNPLEHEVQRYHARLLAKTTTTQKSIRLSISSAASFSMICGGVPSDAALLKYLRTAPGQRNAVYGFIRQLIRYGHAIAPPEKKPTKRRASGPSDIALLLDSAQVTDSYSELKSLVAALLSCLTGIPLKIIVSLPLGAIAAQDNGVVVFTALEMTAYLAPPLAPLLSRYLSKRTSEKAWSRHLFPGRPAAEPISDDAVTHHLRKLGISLLAMESSARMANKRYAISFAPQTL